MHKITMLGTGLIGMFYTMTLQGNRSRDQVGVVYSRTAASAEKFAKQWSIPKWTDDMAQAINDPDTDVVVVGLPNYLHKDAILTAVKAGKAVLCTKPLATSAAEAKEILEAVEKAGVFHGYLEDLVYTPKTLKALESVQKGAIGKVLWARSREAHAGPHSDWFWNKKLSGGGAVIDMGCHCIEVARSFIGKDIKPVEVMCWGATHVHPIEAEDTAIGLVRYENNAIGQFESNWTFRGGMDLRDEVAGTEGTIWLNHWLRTGMEMFSAGGGSGYVAEKAESDTGWLFPVGDEVASLGYVDMFNDMFAAMEKGEKPREDFYDGYVVNAVMDAAYRSMESRQWEPVKLDIWRGKEGVEEHKAVISYDEQYNLVKREKMHGNQTKLILKDKKTGEIVQKVIEE